jgi:hypothetical protein
MNINNMDDLKNAVKERLNIALKMTQEEVYNVIQKNIEKYYEEKVFYNLETNSTTNKPRFYNRTYAFLNSLIKTNVVVVNNSLSCSVEINTESLNYIQDGDAVIDMINRGYHADKSLNDGSYQTPRNIYSEYHFWDDSLEQLGGYDGILSIMKNNCKKVGISIK